MPDTLEKQLRAEILKRQQKNRKPRKQKTALWLLALAALSLAIGFGQRRSLSNAEENGTPQQQEQRLTDYGVEDI